MFDIHFYFARRANENFHDLQVDTFLVCVDYDTHLHYVKKVKDELQKNHKETNAEIITGFMPEIPDSMYCPVKSFKEYTCHLHPENDFLWQAPNERTTTNVWYTAGHLGVHTLEKFMPDLRECCNLSRRYGNHSIRVTGSTILNHGGFSMKQIMSVTGHKSTNSLVIYQKVEKNEKLLMGLTLNAAMMNKLPPASITPDIYDKRFAFQHPPLPRPHQVLPIESGPHLQKCPRNQPAEALGAPPPEKIRALPAPPNMMGTELAVIPDKPQFETIDETQLLSDEELVALLNQFENQEKQKDQENIPLPAEAFTKSLTTVQNMMNQNMFKGNDAPNFSLCKISTVNINIVRK